MQKSNSTQRILAEIYVAWVFIIKFIIYNHIRKEENMDQIKIGKFIAETRKGKNITQKQLADKLSISDKTVSKWECGKGLPDVSIMLELCEELNITVNDLLTGEIVSEIDYQNKAEENMMNLMKENQENKKRMILSVICAVITIIATCSLVITAATGIGAAAELEVKAGYYECPHCKALFVPTMSEYVKGYHTLTKRRLTCHECGKTSMCKHRIVR